MQSTWTLVRAPQSKKLSTPLPHTLHFFSLLLLTRSGRIKTTEFFSIKSLLERLLIWDVIPRGRWLFVSLSCALGLCRSFAGPVSVVGCFHWRGAWACGSISKKMPRGFRGNNCRASTAPRWIVDDLHFPLFYLFDLLINKCIHIITDLNDHKLFCKSML
jgi:hypothetical protein